MIRRKSVSLMLPKTPRSRTRSAGDDVHVRVAPARINAPNCDARKACTLNLIASPGDVSGVVLQQRRRDSIRIDPGR